MPCVIYRLFLTISLFSVPCFSFFISNLIQYIITKFKGEFPTNIEFYRSLYEFGNKSAALFMWAAFGKETSLIVDRHVHNAFKWNEWSQQTKEEDVAWESYQLSPERWNKKNNRTMNEAIGCVFIYISRKKEKVVPMINKRVERLKDMINGEYESKNEKDVVQPILKNLLKYVEHDIKEKKSEKWKKGNKKKNDIRESRFHQQNIGLKN